MEKQYCIIRRSDDSLSHANKAKERAGHKYIKREWKNDRWEYYYKDDIPSNKQIARSQAKMVAERKNAQAESLNKNLSKLPTSVQRTITGDKSQPDRYKLNTPQKAESLITKGKESISKLFNSAVKNVNDAINKGKNFIDQKVESVERARNNDIRNERREAERQAQYEKEHEAWVRNQANKKAFERTDSLSEKERSAAVKEQLAKSSNSYKGPENIQQQRQEMQSRDWEQRRLKNAYRGPESAKEAARQKQHEEEVRAQNEDQQGNGRRRGGSNKFGYPNLTSLSISEERAQELWDQRNRTRENLKVIGEQAQRMINNDRRNERREAEKYQRQVDDLNRQAEQAMGITSAMGGASKDVQARVEAHVKEREEKQQNKEEAGKLAKDMVDKFQESAKSTMSKNSKEKEKERQAEQRDLEEKREARDKAGEFVKDLTKTLIYEPTKDIAKDAAKGLKDYKDPRVKKLEELGEILTKPIADYAETTKNRLATQKFIEEQADKLGTYVDTKLRNQSRRR